jgi:hypothetical protein
MWRLTQAIESQDDFWEVLPTNDYDPEEESWLHLPNSLVRLKQSNRGDFFAVHSDVSAVRIQMPMTGGPFDVTTAYAKPASEDGLFEILPMPEHKNIQSKWFFPPKTKVRLEKRSTPFGEQLWPKAVIKR